MQSTRTRLDRFIKAHTGITSRDIRSVLAQGRIFVDGQAATGISQVIHKFSRVLLDGQLLQAATPIYIMLHKPAGVVSATRDDHHKTVIELLHRPERNSLHLAGRLDFNSSGLLLLTNDGHWSRALSTPENSVAKRYRVTLQNPISREYVHAFSRGMYFDYERITTRPAQLLIIDDHTAEVALVEGRYHQIKRMFGRFNNPVVQLHRLAIGNLELDPELNPGQSRDLADAEVRAIFAESTVGKAWREG